MSRLTVNRNNAFANAGMEAAFRHGGPWLDAVLAYLNKMRTVALLGYRGVEGNQGVASKAYEGHAGGKHPASKEYGSRPK